MEKSRNLALIRQQLFVLGLTALSVGIVPQVIQKIFYPEFGFFTSISASATTGAAVGMVLPFGLGILALFMFTYSGYEFIDDLISSSIGGCFAVVAAQPCYSRWVAGVEKIGVFGLSPRLSNSIHCIAAVIGFILMGTWVALLFTKTDKAIMSNRTRIRNAVYIITGVLCLAGAAVVLFFGQKTDQESSVLVWWAEEVVLIAYGATVLVKSRFSGR